MLDNLVQGLRLAFFFPATSIRFRLSPGAFWFVAVIGALVSVLMGIYATESPRIFQAEGLFSETFLLVAVLAGSFVASKIVGDPYSQYRIPTLFLNSIIAPYVLYTVFEQEVTLAYYSDYPQLFWWSYYALIAWTLLIAYRAISLSSVGLPLRQISAALLLTIITFLPAHYLYFYDFWITDYSQNLAQEPQAPALNAERILSRQGPLLQKQLEKLQASKPGEQDMFFIGYAGWGEQQVFANEVAFAKRLFNQQYTRSEQELILVNDVNNPEGAPLATATNLETALNHMETLIQPEEDILFLFMTSHGGEDHSIASSLSNLPLNDVPAEKLGEILNASPFKWKVVVISACYSGGVIPHLENENTLVITAARSDRTSFGCSDDAEYTYFGRAFLVESLTQTPSFVAAFDKARDLVSRWEKRDGFTPSEPQIRVGEKVLQQLVQWSEKREVNEETHCQTKC
ncbi:conserved hypothetical protein [Hahella chejuensis KCTC 2396]|uniref:Peptidase C13 family protein n=1 Tax=Hahella chejuensis (strain KCTC 2396) TaxID=349521 RepID=Q2SL13_HAHCH|nr:C13 family peptidase [Hahella chejuensis]ABC28661.1 conserved hypothetical protein [Hahella chejuensis KCTC 2396]